MPKLGIPELMIAIVLALFVYIAYRLWMAGQKR